MSDLVLFALLGLATGSMYGALALGVVVVHRGTGVVNFALGAQAMFPAVVYAELRTTGDLILPVVFVPDRYALGPAMGLLPAAAIAVVVGALISVVAYLLVLRPLRDAPPLNVIVATVGMVIVLQALAVRSFGSRTVKTPGILPRSSVEVFGRIVPVDRLWMAGVVLAVALLLGALYGRTRFGLATRAGASSEKGATLLGYDLVRIGLANFVLASVIVTAIGILLSSLSGVNPFNYTVFVIPALAAALAGGLRSFWWAAVAGLLIGSMESLSVHFVANGWVPNFFTGGFDSAVSFTAIVVILFFGGRTLPTRGVIVDRYRITVPMPSTKPWAWGAMVVAALALAVRGDHTVRLGLIQSGWVFVLLLSMVVITGYLGQISLAQLAFAGLAAFMLAELSEGWGVPFPLAPLAAVAATTVIGTIVAVPALRLRGVQYAIVTFAAAFVFERLVFRSPSFLGDGAIARIAPPELFGVELGILRNGSFPSRTYAVITVLVAAGAALLVARVRMSGTGRRFLATRMNERAAAAAGIDVVRQKLTGAALSSFLAAVAGILYGYKTIDLTNRGLEADEGLQFLALAFLGGIATISGAVVGGLIAPSGLLLVTVFSGNISEDVFLAIGFGVLLATRVFPSGIAGFVLGLRRQPAAVVRVATDADGPVLRPRG